MCIYIYVLYMHIYMHIYLYIYEYIYIYIRQMDPQAIKHRGLAYCYTAYIYIHRHENRFGNEMTTFHTFGING